MSYKPGFIDPPYNPQARNFGALTEDCGDEPWLTQRHSSTVACLAPNKLGGGARHILYEINLQMAS